jgi:hypothetical protein
MLLSPPASEGPIFTEVAGDPGPAPDQGSWSLVSGHFLPLEPCTVREHEHDQVNGARRTASIHRPALTWRDSTRPR